MHFDNGLAKHLHDQMKDRSLVALQEAADRGERGGSASPF
jgi:hypothetical protein